MIVYEQQHYKNTHHLARSLRNLVMEISAFDDVYFVCGSTEAGCRRRADAIYGKGNWKEVVIKPVEEVL